MLDMTLQVFTFRKFSVTGDAFAVLHLLMYLPGGSIKLDELRKSFASELSNDIKKIAMYCHQRAYIDFNGELIQLTDTGLQFYLEQKCYFSNHFTEALL